MQRKYDLVCFDLDGTLIEEENGDVLWARMAKLVHKNDSINKKRMKDYLDGKMSLKAWATLDLSDWKSYGVTKKLVETQAKNSKLIFGAKETLLELENNGIKLGVISGSVDVLLDTVFPEHPFDDIFINKLFFDKAGVLSHWELNEFGNSNKGEALRIIAKREKIPLERTVFIGDHLNDISAFNIAGLSIAFNTRLPELKKHCDVVIEKKDLREVLKFIL